MNLQHEGVGVALSGGSARGMAHLGVLQALENHGITPTCIAGTSMGAVIGSIYAAGVSPREIYEFARKQHYLGLIRPSFKEALFRPSFLRKMLDHLIPDIETFEELPRRMFVSLTNLNTAKYEIVSTGALKDAVVASASIPMVFEPSVINGQTYVDGGVLNNLPVEPLTERCRYVIGVSVNPIKEPRNDELDSMIDIMSRVLTIVVAGTELERRRQCDYYIEVAEAANLRLIDFSHVDDFYRMGLETVERFIGEHPEMMTICGKK